MTRIWKIDQAAPGTAPMKRARPGLRASPLHHVCRRAEQRDQQEHQLAGVHVAEQSHRGLTGGRYR